MPSAAVQWDNSICGTHGTYGTNRTIGTHRPNSINPNTTARRSVSTLNCAFFLHRLLCTTDSFIYRRPNLRSLLILPDCLKPANHRDDNEPRKREPQPLAVPTAFLVGARWMKKLTGSNAGRKPALAKPNRVSPPRNPGFALPVVFNLKHKVTRNVSD